MKKAKCPWCAKEVPVTKSGFLASHLNGGGQKCVGIGKDAKQADAFAKERDESVRRIK